MRAILLQLHAALKDLTGVEFIAQDWAPTPDPKLGDFAIPCFKASKLTKENPAALASRLAPLLAEKMPTTVVQKVQAVGAYLNITVQSQLLMQTHWKTLSEDPAHFGSAEIGAGKTILVEFSSPNVAKEIGLHHIRSTAIGNSLASIAGWHGYKTIKLNYLGDWGTTFGKHLVAQKLWGSEKELQEGGLSYMLKNYVRFNQEAKLKPELDEEARAAFRDLEQDDPEKLRLWHIFRDVSVREFKRIYDRLGVSFDFYDGEALYNKALDPVINSISEKIGTRISEGALVYDLPGHKIPVLLRKDDGASLYITRDFAAIEDRNKRFPDFAMCLYVVSLQQRLHFSQLFDTLKLLGKNYATRLKHIDYGMLSFGAKTMKTREGNVIALEEVLDEGKKRALALIQEKNPELPNIEATAEAVGTGALLFSDLSTHRNHDVKFDWESALSFEGDTGPFVQYTHARCRSLWEKGIAHLKTLDAHADPLQALSPSPGVEELLQHEAVHALLKEWSFFEIYGERALENWDSSQIAASLLLIAKSFNQLYHKIRFLDEQDAARLMLLLQLCRGTEQILKLGLSLLGIKAPYPM